MSQLISHYRILKKLGAGGMGDVYLAQDISLNRYVAIKLLPRQFTRDPERLGRFFREAQVASVLNHPNILTIHEIGEHEETHFIVTEFVDGETLAQKMKGGPLPISEAVTIAVGICDALVAAHDYWIVHRDIKPENVMLRKDGYVKVLDFGLAKLTEPAILGGANRFNTQPGLVPGSVRYVAPERLRGEAVDPRADLFSLGILIYEMVTAQYPFQASSVIEIIEAILKKEPAPMHTLRADVPAELDAVVKRLLEKETTVRYQTSREVAGDLLDLKHELDFAARQAKRGR